MGCCGGDMVAERSVENASELARSSTNAELLSYGHKQDDGLVSYVFSCPNIHCGSCIAVVEKELSRIEKVRSVRVNLTLKRITVIADPGSGTRWTSQQFWQISAIR